MNINDKTIIIYEGITYIFCNDDKPNKEIRGVFFTDDSVVIIYKDGTSSVCSIQSVKEKGLLHTTMNVPTIF
jgi:hypothetical protein